jgi:hypothetical protein
MELRLEREPTIDERTWGKLYIDNTFYCYTIEDAVRAQKIPGRTAIPAGRYLIRITPSARFKRRLPELIDVPNYKGVRIHPGNTIEDTEGCLLPGLERTTVGVAKSRLAFEPLLARLERAPGPHWITICQQDSKPIT